MKVKERTIVQVIGHIVMIIFALAAVLPFLLMIVASFTDSDWATANGFSFFPAQWSLAAYKYIANQWQTIGQAYLMTFLVTIVGTALSLLVVCLFAYGVSHTDYPGMKFLNFICVFTMLFNGGIVTTYYVWTNYFNIRNSFWALVLPNLLMSAFNVMLVKNYFKFSIPESLLEAARIDGAGEIRIFAKIVMPLSLPILATIGLMTAITYWNDWTNGLYYLTDRGGSHLFTIQLVLNKINENINFLAQNASALGSGVDVSSIPTTTARMAIAVVGILPILIAYPFFQRFFVKGIMLGGVKE